MRHRIIQGTNDITIDAHKVDWWTDAGDHILQFKDERHNVIAQVTGAFIHILIQEDDGL